MSKLRTLPVTLVVTVLNEAASIEALLTAVAAQTKLPAEMIIVDGGSTDQTVTLAQHWTDRLGPTHLKVMVHPGNRSRGRNKGIAQATQPWLAITDAGCIPEPNWLAELWTQAQSMPQPAIVAGAAQGQAITPLQEAIIPYVLVMPDQVKQPFLPATRSVLLSKSAWEVVGQFNEALSDNEDYEWSRRLPTLLETNQLHLKYAARAVVMWLPRRTLGSFSWMLYRFARGDAQAGLWRPKVGWLLARYTLGLIWLVVLLAVSWLQPSDLTPWGWILTVLVMLGYFLFWPVFKNGRYVARGWYWLPVLQVLADLAVLSGSMIGWWRRYTARKH